MPKKLCSFGGCHTIIAGTEKYCEEHKKVVEEKEKERHRIYKSKRTDKKYQSFYTSKEWIQLRDFINIKYKGMCLWSYYIEHTIIPAATVHHIVEVKDDWHLRLDIYNCIPLSEAIHQKIHRMYESDKEDTQKALRYLISKWNGFERNEMNETIG